MTTKKYFYDPSAETLTVVELDQNGDIVGITELSDPYVLVPMNSEDQEEEDQEEEEQETALPTPSTPTAKVRRCGKCGQPGHQARTCPDRVSVEPEHDDKPNPLKFVPGTPSLRERIKVGRDEGVSLHEMYELFPDHEMAEIAAVYSSLEREEDTV